MSKVKRYSVSADYGYACERYEDPKGEFVDYKDYAALKAENERLRKAGDYLADHLAHEFGTCPSIEVWQAAKEGKPSVK